MFGAVNRQAVIGCLVLLVIVSTVTSAGAGDLRQAIETAEVIRTFPVKGAPVRRAMCGRDILIVELQNSDSDFVVGYSLSGEQRYKVSFPNSNRSFLSVADISTDGSSVVLAYAHQGEGGAFRTVVVDELGTELCTLNSFYYGGRLSPTGRYVTPFPSELNVPPSVVVDCHADGRTIPLPNSINQITGFLDENTAIQADQAHARLIDLPSGKIRDSISLPLWTPIGSGSPSMSPPSSDGNIAIHRGHQVLIVSKSLRVLHHRILDGYIGKMFPSNPPGWFVATVQRLDGVRCVLALSATDPSSTVRSDSSSVIWRVAGCLGCPITESLDYGVIAILPHTLWGEWRPDYAPFETIFAEFDPDSLTISKPFAVHGIYLKARGETVPPDTYLRVYPPDTVQLVRLNR
ncbi:MAG: hypothetical protein GF341_08200 [candidate division Zixibacteria bacterium]|nr:hypothetical protein [candidate division Zixibacteria bacterium]